MLYYAEMNSYLGKITLVSDETHLKEVWIEGQKGISIDNCKLEITPILTQAIDWLERYFSNQRPNSKELSILLEGSPFQLFIWEELCNIPYGEVTTYKALAEKAASRFHKKRMSAQAVGGAVGKNPISIIMPCHRVIGSNGALVGYQGGLNLKIQLLKHEGVSLGEIV
ncbi:MAG: methylated-DNA--[protein]-cysteine S-methyltransferase [Acholeplasmatales bacterium]|jgi:methylated-DNA-[protein]-cysteine S-methyltransferase|nr:methylated-DNA--[protein]-cysteine S-methyltransferase [Acholeplasmatales bacterium]